MASGYPASLDTFATTSPTNLGDDDAQARDHAERHDDVGDAMTKVQAELGTDPAGEFSTVADSVNGRMRRGIPSSGESLVPGLAHQSGQTFTLNQLVVAPIWVPAPMSIDGLTIYCSVAEAGSSIRLGLWANAGAGVDAPGALVVDGGTVDTTTIGLKVATVSESLQSGLYWFGAVAQGSASTVNTFGTTYPPRLNDGNTPLAKYYAYGKTGVSGALPDPFGTPTGYIIPVPCVGLRRA